MENKAKLTEIIIRDFKNIKNKVFKLAHLNDFYGANKVGKSSILEAVHFAFEGGKNDVDKIRVGAQKAIVELKGTKGDLDLESKTTLNTAGNLYCTAKLGGKRLNNPRSFLTNLFGFGTFNPRAMLDKKGRTERLLQLIPLRVKKEDLSLPGLKEFPIRDLSAFNFNRHAFYVLEALDKDLRDTRWMKGREKDLFEKSIAKRTQDLNHEVSQFKQHYDNKNPYSDYAVGDEIIGKMKRIEIQKEQLILDDKKARESLAEYKSEKDSLNQSIQKSKEAVQKFKQDIQDLKNKITQQTERIHEMESNIAKDNDIIEKLEKDMQGLPGRINDYNDQINKIKQSLTISRSAEKIKQTKADIEKEEKELIDKTEDWKKWEDLVKVSFPALREKVLEPIKEKVPGLNFSGGNFTYNGIPIDTLSGSEVIALSLKLMCLQEKSNFLLINEAECLDKNSLQSVRGDLEKFNSILMARVADTPAGSGWKSTEILAEE